MTCSLGSTNPEQKDWASPVFEVRIFQSDQDYTSWSPFLIENGGIYNGQAADLEQDGDYDIFRYQTHDARAFHLYKNEIIDATSE